MRLLTILTALCTLLISAAVAAPTAYALDRANTTVAYEVPFGDGAPIKGRLPVVSADIDLDFAGRGSKVDVVLDARGATASIPFAVQALRGRKVLDSKSFPHIRFQAEKFPIGANSATVTGVVTLRGVSRPVTLKAQVFRQEGVAVGERSRMSVHLSGEISRSAFGANGWPDLVGDTVSIQIVAPINRQG